jgi:hypothetical protein
MGEASPGVATPRVRPRALYWISAG